MLENRVGFLGMHSQQCHFWVQCSAHLRCTCMPTFTHSFQQLRDTAPVSVRTGLLAGGGMWHTPTFDLRDGSTGHWGVARADRDASRASTPWQVSTGV